MEFSRHEYWSGLPCPPPGDLPDPGIEPTSLRSPALAGRFFTTSATWEALVCMYLFKLVCLFSLGKHPEVKSLNHMAILLLIFQGTFILFSIVTASVYIPTSSVLKESQIFSLKSTGSSKSTYAFLLHSRRNQNILLLLLGLFSCYFANFFYLLIFGCGGSSLLHGSFL